MDLMSSILTFISATGIWVIKDVEINSTLMALSGAWIFGIQICLTSFVWVSVERIVFYYKETIKSIVGKNVSFSVLLYLFSDHFYGEPGIITAQLTVVAVSLAAIITVLALTPKRVVPVEDEKENEDE